VPAKIARRAGELPPLSAAYGAYSTRAAWPQDWDRLTAALGDAPNAGLLLRWRAALHEMARFDAVAPALRLRILERLGIAVEENFRHFHWAMPLRGTPPRRTDSPTGEAWAERRSIFSFLIAADSRHGAGRVLDFEEARRVHRWLGEDLTPVLTRATDPAILAKPCFLGHPVKARRTGDSWGGALRIAIGAPLVSDIAGTGAPVEDFERRLDAAVADIDLVFRKLDLILRNYDTLAASPGVEDASP
jgi:hypothetical protein